MKVILLISVAMLSLILLTACGSDPTATLVPPTSTPTPQINKVSFTAEDYSFTGPASITAGMTAITLVNEGEELHHQQLVKLAEGMTVQGLLAELESDAEGPPPPGISISGGVAALTPGVSGSVTWKLATT